MEAVGLSFGLDRLISASVSLRSIDLVEKDFVVTVDLKVNNTIQQPPSIVVVVIWCCSLLESNYKI